jgi:2-polyprenyl-6-methoxyphenol hydroxylase-like FAD-dependent oxidoreductase
MGLGGVLGRTGQHPSRMNIYWQDRRLNAVDFRHLQAPVQSFITQPQWQTEHELENVLTRRGVQVRRGVELVDLAETTTGVSATLRSGSEARQEQYRFVVGCDGKASRVREHLGISLRGVDYPSHFVLGDFELSSKRLRRGEVHYFVYEDTFFIFVPLAEGRWRVVVKHDGPCPEGPPPASLIPELVESRFGERMFQGEAAWLSRAPFYLRVANALGNERLFLAGDAAHLFSPIGGTGMNTGMNDACNLAWKLACVHHGHARGAALLKSYGQERLEEIRRTAALTDLSTRLITRQERDPTLVVPYLPTLRNRHALKRDLPLQHSGLAVSYGPSLAISGEIPGGGWTQPGRMLLGLGELRELLAAAGRPCGACDLLVVALAEPRRDVAGLRELARELLGLQAEYGPLCRAMVLTSEEKALPVCPSWLAVPSTSRLERTLRLPSGAVCLVRPDGVVAWGGSLSQLDGLRPFLASMLGRETDAQAVA